ncbi:amidohydrolase family protein [Sulfitobacter sp. D35]|uniref:amidohydrolase family protein n=1 Tax=Sulfitobacter sp. D35 TaxID=3083252 RepID=UPI00296E351E|nr:amidohydrolase family protein [Sulfitobacter sp. D35]MDW4500044.1 amidohydrolase family protein [Sulfitobacter sp. D35]
MSRVELFDGVVPRVLVPRSLLTRPERFGGRTVGDCLAGDLILRAGRVTGLRDCESEPERVVMSRLTETHVHLDKCHTIGRMPRVGGDLADAIAAQRSDKANWSVADLRRRMTRGMHELRDAGCGAVRSHVDWGDDPDPAAVPPAWDVLEEVAVDFGPGIVLQRAALTSIAALSDAAYADGCAARIARDGGVLGAFVFDQPERRAGIANAFRAADRHGLALDFHVDEGLAPGLDGLEMIADAALGMRFEGPVLCGHACSLANLSGAPLRRIADKLARAGISVAVLPWTNLYLQGRGDGTPDRRGLTRVHELRAAGVNVVVGTDNVGDAFCPLGAHAPTRTLALAAVAAHLDPPFADHLQMITTAAAQALGLPPVHIDGAAVDDLLAFEATSTADLLGRAPAPRPLSHITGARP